MLTIKREADVISLCALTLAIITALAQLAQWTRGPEVEFLGPDRVVLYQDSANGVPIIRVAAPLSFANIASQSYSAILARETVSLRVGNRTSEQVWNAFGQIQQRPEGLGVAGNSLVAPQTVSGQSAVSHFTLFAPLPKPCEPGQVGCSATENYIDPAAILQLKAGDTIRLRFTGHFFKEEARQFDCQVRVTDAMLKRWAARPITYELCRTDN